jgi:hypothetical protein
LKLYYEIDEAQHGSDQHKIKDEHRQREIIDATDFIEKRISIFDKNKNDRNINEINKEVEEFIAFVQKRKKQFISKGNFIPWDYETKFNPAPHLKRGYIDVKDNVVFSNHRDALGCFGYKKGHYQRAVWRIKGSNKEVWFPKLYRNNTWNNSLSNDFKKIIMKRNNNAKIKRRKKREFIVFAHYKDLLGQIVYKFLGEFHTLFKESDNYQRAFIRKKTKIYFKDFDV